VLAQNVANSDTRDFKPRDLTPLQFEQAGSGTAALTLRRPEGIQTAYAAGSMSGLQAGQSRGFDARPSGTAVNLEDEMLRSRPTRWTIRPRVRSTPRVLADQIAIGKR